MGASWNRRDLLRCCGALAVLMAPAAALAQRAADRVTPLAANVKALVFDTFGTLVDWRGSIVAEGAVWGKAKGLEVDWAKFADRWRAGYPVYMQKVRSGELPWTNIDGLHRGADSIYSLGAMRRL